MKRLKRILSELHPELEITQDTRLIDDGILDSLDVVTLVTDINAEYRINVGAEDITPGSFNTLEGICALIRARGGEICSL